MSRIRHAFLIITGKLPSMEDDMLDQTTQLATQLDGLVKSLVSAISTANSTISSQNQTIAELQSQLQSDAATADNAGVALLQPIVSEAEAAVPAQQQSS
jgi:ABC-type transporter Mla subunit MlaD